jgi:hypothetical protein
LMLVPVPPTVTGLTPFTKRFVNACDICVTSS